MSASEPHADEVIRRPDASRRERGTALAPIAFHSAVPYVSLVSTDDLGAASYISPPP